MIDIQSATAEKGKKKETTAAKYNGLPIGNRKKYCAKT